MLVAMSVLALLGLRHPQRMLPILLFEVAWKLTWLAVVALPLWLGDGLEGATREQGSSNLWVAIIIAVIRGATCSHMWSDVATRGDARTPCPPSRTSRSEAVAGASKSFESNASRSNRKRGAPTTWLGRPAHDHRPLPNTYVHDPPHARVRSLHAPQPGDPTSVPRRDGVISSRSRTSVGDGGARCGAFGERDASVDVDETRSVV